MTLTCLRPQGKQETLKNNWSKVEEGVRKDETTMKDFHVRLERLQAQRNDYKTHDEKLILCLKTDLTSKVEVILHRSNMFSLFQTPFLTTPLRFSLFSFIFFLLGFPGTEELEEGNRKER